MKRAAAPLLILAGLAACATVSTTTPGVRAPPPAAPRSYTPQVVRASQPLECVPYARQRSGVLIFGDAHTWPAQAEGRYRIETRPRVGAVLALGGTRGGHLAYVKAILSEREILVDHANWANDGLIHIDAPVRDVSTRGDWSEVRVWHMGTRQLGVTSYPVRGFILAE